MIEEVGKSKSAERRGVSSTALIQNSLRESELAGKHFEMVAELNARHMRREIALSAESQEFRERCAKLEKSLAALEQLRAQVDGELRAATQKENRLKGELRRKSGDIARLERDVAAARDKIVDLEAHLLLEKAEKQEVMACSRAEIASLQEATNMQREEMQHRMDRLRDDMGRAIAAYEQWLHQAAYLLDIAMDHLISRQRAGGIGHRRDPERIATYLEYIGRWRNRLGEHLDGLKATNDDNCRSLSLDRLLKLHDRQFVRSAYMTLLHREPDVAGEAHYLRRVREGDNKLVILGELRHSAEGRLVDPGIAGLDRSIKQNKLAQLLVIGWFFRRLFRIERDSRANRKVRAYQNALGALLSGVEAPQAELLAMHL